MIEIIAVPYWNFNLTILEYGKTYKAKSLNENNYVVSMDGPKGPFDLISKKDCFEELFRN